MLIARPISSCCRAVSATTAIVTVCPTCFSKRRARSSPAFRHSFPEFPIPGTQGHAWYLSPNGVLGDSAPGGKHADGFKWNAAATPKTDFSGDTAGGAGAVRLWVRSSTPDVDLQATVSEVRPDGIETFVQNGWLRANERKLDPRKSKPLEPVLSLRKADVKPMPKGRFVKLTIPLYYEGHAYRAGSRIRLTISAPNGSQPIWAFDHTQPAKGGARVAIAYSKKMPSQIVLPVVLAWARSLPWLVSPIPRLGELTTREKLTPSAGLTSSCR